ncbi:phage tail protein [Chimaeribacter californicus]|uniref:Phage tail protein n=1 Tax=Chimaeribacter californicus TaxID=2060067 RepID=A0A2N5EEG3_9GAMM|nr:phage tail protein [Chimaeribacter californicus]PLR40921.1 phage tail protein [Chimaeribacter californicus]
MLKQQHLRQTLLEQVPVLTRNPEQLTLTLGEMQIVSTLAPSLCFEYRYPLIITITELSTLTAATTLDNVTVVILAWLRENQPDLLSSTEKRRSDFTCRRVDSGDLCTLMFTLQLTERVLVTEQDGAAQVTHLPEPPLPQDVAAPHEVYLDGELISSWTE